MSHDKRQLAIYTIIFSIWWVFSLGALGFSKAITVRVGQLLGANEPRKAKRSAINLSYNNRTVNVDIYKHNLVYSE